MSKFKADGQVKRVHSSVLMPSSKQMTFKVILIGQSFTGKTSLMNKYVHNKFTQKYDVTVGVDFASKFVKVFDQDERQIFVQLQLWDTCGQDVFKSLTASFFRGSCAVFLIYSVNDIKSFQKVSQWLQKFHQQGNDNALLFLIGNKCDLQRCISKQDQLKFLKQIKGVFVIQTSAKSGQNVQQLFSKAAQILVKKYYTSAQFRQLVKPKNDVTVSFVDQSYLQSNNGQNNKNSFLLSDKQKFQDSSKKKNKCCFR